MEAISLLLGISSLFPTCIQGYQVLASASSFPRESSVLYWKLKTQEMRFTIWGQAYGLNPEQIEPGQTEVTRTSVNSHHSLAVLKLTHGVLLSIKEIICDAEKLTSRYGLQVAETPTFQLNPKQSSAKAAANRLRWAIQDKSAFEKLVADLREFNDGLYATLTPQTRANVEFAVSAQLPGETEEARELQVLQEVSVDNEPLRATSSFKTFNIELHLQGLSHPKSDVGMEYQLSDLQFMSHNWQSEDRGVVCLPKSASGRANAIFVEWKSYHDTIQSVDMLNASLLRIQRLARLLGRRPKPPDFQTLDCIGYTYDRFRERVGLLSSLPKDSPPRCISWSTLDREMSDDTQQERWISLHELIGLCPKLPLLGHRYSLALALVKSMIQLHSTGWLHKGFQSSNVMYFDTGDGPCGSLTDGSSLFADTPAARRMWYNDIRHPKITGFEFARPNSSSEFSDNTQMWHSRHPAYIDPVYLYSASDTVGVDSEKRFKPEYDMFSLGCVLLEIGLWRRLTDFWKEEYLHAGPTVWRTRLCKKYVPEIGGRCGEVYQTVVYDLLQQGLSEKSVMNPYGGSAHALTNFELVHLLEQLHV